MCHISKIKNNPCGYPKFGANLGNQLVSHLVVRRAPLLLHLGTHLGAKVPQPLVRLACARCRHIRLRRRRPRRARGSQCCVVCRLLRGRCQHRLKRRPVSRQSATPTRPCHMQRAELALAARRHCRKHRRRDRTQITRDRRHIDCALAPRLPAGSPRPTHATAHLSRVKYAPTTPAEELNGCCQ